MGKPGVTLSAFVAKIDTMRAQTQGLNLREIIELMLAESGYDRTLSRRAGGGRSGGKPGRTGQCRRELCDAGRVWP